MGDAVGPGSVGPDPIGRVEDGADGDGPDEDGPGDTHLGPSDPGSASPWTARWPVLARGLLLAAAVLVGVLVVTGAVLSTEYRPSASEAWPALDVAADPGDASETLRTLHRWASTLLLPVAVLLAIIGWVLVVRRRSWVPAVGLVLAVVAAGVTGYMVAWDQLALWAVTVGSDLSGVWSAAFGDDIRFVIVDGTEVSQSTYRNALIAHLLLTAGVVAALVGIARLLRRVAGNRLSRGGRAAPARPDPPPPDPA